LQWIRYNGISLDSLLHITSILCPEGLVKIDSIELAQDNIHFIITYRVDTESTVTFKRQRIFLLEYIIGMKFKQFMASAE
jgi:REP element-mobilizing transposase RayT